MNPGTVDPYFLLYLCLPYHMLTLLFLFVCLVLYSTHVQTLMYYINQCERQIKALQS